MRPVPFACLLLASVLGACATPRFDQGGANDEAAYAARNPFYAEYCALSQIKKQPGFGADIRGEIGGHAVFYLNGACRVAGAHYPLLHVCDGLAEGDGVGLSMNAHFRNAKFMAVPGRAFFFDGGVAPGAALTRERYRQVQAEAQRLDIYDGVAFNDWVFDDMPPGWSRAAWMYEMSAATDYAIGMGRGRYCARVPVDRAAMQQMVDFLNKQNEPYRLGAKTFDWSVFTDNCIHLAHNALAAAGIGEVWPINRPLPLALFDFPVPKNEFVNTMRRTNAALPPDPGAVYRDPGERRSLLEHAVLPQRPDALAEAAAPRTPNAVYDTDVKLVFYDEPMLNRYGRRFEAIFADPRFTDPAASRAAFAGQARQIEAARKPLDWWLAQAPYSGDPAGFGRVYDAFYTLMRRLAVGEG